jgi:hypothetical protein
MPPCALKRAHWARAITWALTFWAIDRPSEPQLSNWSCELDAGHPLHSSIAGGSCERSRRFLRSHALQFSGQIRATFAALRLIGATKAAVGREVVASYDEESARSMFSGQWRAPRHHVD